MRSSLIAAYLLTLGLYAPGAVVRQQFPPAPPQAHTVPLQLQAQTELDRRGMAGIRRGNASVVADSPVVRRVAEARPPGGPATYALPPHPGNQQSGNRQLPGPVGLLLAVALLDGEGAAPHKSSQAETR